MNLSDCLWDFKKKKKKKKSFIIRNVRKDFPIKDIFSPKAEMKRMLCYFIRAKEM